MTTPTTTTERAEIVLPMLNSFFNMLSNLTELNECPDLSPIGIHNKLIGSIQALISEFNISENEFNVIAKKFKGMDLIYFDFTNK